MTAKFVLGAAAITCALALGLPAMAAEGDMAKPDKPAAEKTMHHRHHHAMRHHEAMHHDAAVHHTGAHHRMHMHKGDMGVDAKERAETERLNREQANQH